MRTSTILQGRHGHRSALRAFTPVLCAALLMAALAAPASAAKLGPSLTSRLNGLANASPVGTVIVAFNTSTGLKPSHLMDVLSDGLFHPTSKVARADLAETLIFNTALRQSLADSPRYTDVTGRQAAIAEAVTADGSTLRDYDFAPSGLLTASGSTFSPAGAVSRLDLAAALVKALGLDAAAQAKAGSDVTATQNGQTVIVSDQSGIPSALRGYMQLALDRGILSATFTTVPSLAATVDPNGSVTRSDLAFALDHYRQAFAAGN